MRFVINRSETIYLLNANPVWMKKVMKIMSLHDPAYENFFFGNILLNCQKEYQRKKWRMFSISSRIRGK